MKTLELNDGYKTELDDIDYYLLKDIKWKVVKNKRTGYLRISSHRSYFGVSRNISLSREVFYNKHNFYPEIVDHIDRNPLNNKRDNLREANASQNTCNSKPKGKSKYKGVHIWKANIKGKEYTYYASRIKVGDKNIHIGYFKNEIEAAKAYNEHAIKYHKEFAYINKID